MNASQSYIAISIAALAIIVILLFVVNKNKKPKKLTTLASLAFGFILAGLFFGNERIVGYSLMGVGVIFAVTDIVIKLRKKE